ncbi:hypothetical protein H5410_038399 [Solanum commersonii]|uniref:NAC domain-containing protein n=1 Tax=Solanum commersonii TaxID=4109 RepID=A0A9J5YB82_SOLCO|nr:hypothetical protein H5410_038399 [Solanum commersonii]
MNDVQELIDSILQFEDDIIFFKGELCLNQQCPIQIVDIYRDQPPWEIFGANSEEKFCYFITPLKKQKIEYKRFSRICAKRTWKAQTGEHLIRRNHTALVVGFKRNFKFETSECGQNKTWLMVEYYVAGSFFKENNHILKEDFVVCRIKKKMDKEKNVDHVMEAQDGDVAGIIDPMLLEPNHNNNYSTTKNQVRVWDEQEATTSEYDVHNSTYEATTMENRETTLEVQEGHRVDDIRSDEFQEEMYREFEDIHKTHDNENGVSDENMNDIEELIDSSLQLEDDINVEEDDVGDEIFEGANSYTHYFITPQKKQNLKWKRVSRTVGKGTWKPQGKGKEVFDNKGRLMGYVKSLKYTYGKSDNKNANGEWLMTEYSLYDGYLGAREIKNKGYVICRIKKRKPNDNNENGVSNENMNDVEELIDSSLQLEDDINVEEDDVGDEVLAILDKEDDGDPNVECLEGHS